MPTIHVVAESSLPAERVLQAAFDFSERRERIWQAVSMKRMEVHERDTTWADVTEGTRAGPVVNWERCRYDWSNPGSVTATVIDSNVYAHPGSSWEMTAAANDGGSHVEMTWEREFKTSARGRFFGTMFRLMGNRLFGQYARRTLRTLETLER